MISSAVIIPDEPEALSPSTNSTHEQTASLKRRQSALSESPDPSKRPRLDTESSTISNTHNGATSSSSPHGTQNATSPVARAGEEMSPPRRRPTAKLDEKSRNRRLFGALLGNLAQPAARTKPSPKNTANTTTTTTVTAATNNRREDIESRQRQRLKRESEEISQHAQRKRQELNSKRKVEQRRWDEQGLRIKHANMRPVAGFLRTSTEPRLYYKPWEMRPEEEETVKKQQEEVEETIQREWDAWEAEKRRQEDDEKESQKEEEDKKKKPDDKVDPSSPDERTQERHVEVPAKDLNGTANGKINKNEDDAPSQGAGRPPSRSSNREVSPTLSATAANRAREPGSDKPQSSKDDDHGGEELELGQGQEDDVIY